MGRPKKVKSDAEIAGQADASAKETSDKIERLEVALGIYKQEDGSYYLAEVIYDPITGEASLEDLHNVGASKIEASERFKIEAVKKGFV